MFSVYPYTSLSWAVAVVFTIGSVVWIVSSFFTFHPTANPDSAFPGEDNFGAGLTACVGSAVFLIGSILLVHEVVNENREGCWGWALVREQSDGPASFRVVPDKDDSDPTNCGETWRDSKDREPGAVRTKWAWWPSWHDFRNHYFHELRFWASMVQVTASVVFFWSGITALPGLQDELQKQKLVLELYWTPKLIGCIGFVISGLLATVEVQDAWYKPKPFIVGWQVSFWKTVGSNLFLLYTVFGVVDMRWWSALACLVGSIIFLAVSLLTWYEAVNMASSGQPHEPTVDRAANERSPLLERGDEGEERV
ncbi:Hypothetical predicted protein [Lecanosticta acicola]|uniref:Uncharacterized protein n=1 Tax=Lecanosticta acicola TaxID=111012 RepID=A0AAI8YVD7_9PEZI|nr:Hypothetical predicted protein [Lecanosticta acicola]